MSDYIGKDGEHLDVIEWGRLYQDPSYFMLAHYKDDKYSIATTWIGFGEFIYNTIVLNSDDKMICTFRYKTQKEAIDSHPEVIRFMLNRDRKEKYAL